MVWILDWSKPIDNEYSVTLFSSEKEALEQACSNILDHIVDDWDMESLDDATDAQEINNLIAMGAFRDAVEHWNSCDTNSDHDGIQFYYVYEQGMELNHQAPAVLAPDFFVALLDEEEEEEEEEEEDEEATNPGIPFRATSPGATCRGTHAEYNPDAYADKADGTYLCQQCKMFKTIFGS